MVIFCFNISTNDSRLSCSSRYYSF